MKKHLIGIGILFVLLAATFPAFGNSELKGRFAGFDINGDGALNRQEVGPISRRFFDEFDRNGDGQLKSKELRRFMIELGRQQQIRRRPVKATAPVLKGERIGFDDVTAYLEQTKELAGLEGIALVVARQGAVIYEKYLGDLSSDSVVPIASGSKWITAALLLSLVDDGFLALDEPLADQLPYLNGTPSAGVTLRHALSHTSGFGSEHLMKQPFDMEFAASARAAANTKRIAPPGEVFLYTGSAMQLAASAAEVATGQSWAELFEERLAKPLGLIHTAYGHPMREIGFHNNRNLIVAAGVHTTACEYMRFLEMIAENGDFRGDRVLSRNAISEMETDQTRGLRQVYKPRGVKPDWGYGLGQWCEQTDANGRCTKVNSAGAFGTFPWVDRSRDIYGVLLVVDKLQRLRDRILMIRELLETVIDDGLQLPANPTGRTSPQCEATCESR